ncbi:MAG: cobalamin biosynthesis protein [Butyrivibrio sp.]|nr:cobalamin biosynthesis protein [Butyrivibrio sp.]
METAEFKYYKFICFTDAGCELIKRTVAALCENEDVDEEVIVSKVNDLKDWTASNFQKGNTLVFIGAMGIAVRAIAPFVKDKTTDPAVIVIDEKGHYVIPVLSGHIGGGVEYSKRLAEIVSGEAVITTATDVEGLFAVDVFAKDHDMVISDMKKAKEFSAGLLRNKTATYYVDEYFEEYLKLATISAELRKVHCIGDNPDMIITPAKTIGKILQLIPKCLVVGMGCKKGTDTDKLCEFCKEYLEEAGFDIRSVKAVTSIDIKGKELGLIELSKRLNAEFVTFSAEKLMEQEGDFSSSDFVKNITGADNICERSVMAYGCEKLLIKKRSQDGMTLAVGIKRYE